MGHSTCCNCPQELGEGTKVQPTEVVPADGKGGTEVYCPPCFVAKRMHEEGPRFQAHQTCVIVCRACGWKSVSFGAQPRRANRCNHCGNFAGKKVPLPELPISPREAKDFVDAAHAAGGSVSAASR